MSMKVTAGKRAGLDAVSDERGVIGALALDQRGLLKNMLAKEMGAEPLESMLMEFKRLTASTLTRETSSILLDAVDIIRGGESVLDKGLLLAYEKSGYSPQFPEKLPTLTEGWSAMRLKEAALTR
jgi:tagatose 1,6-diphosphate aldolase